jgi:hypothetical protein
MAKKATNQSLKCIDEKYGYYGIVLQTAIDTV